MLKKLRFDPKLCTDAFQSEITAQLYTCDIPRLWNGFSFCLVATIRLISDQLVFLKNYQITKLISLGWVLSTLQRLWILKRWLRKESIHVIASAISFWFVLKVFDRDGYSVGVGVLYNDQNCWYFLANGKCKPWRRKPWRKPIIWLNKEYFLSLRNPPENTFSWEQGLTGGKMVGVWLADLFTSPSRNLRSSIFSSTSKEPSLPEKWLPFGPFFPCDLFQCLLPHLCQVWYTTALLRPVKNTPKNA